MRCWLLPLIAVLTLSSSSCSQAPSEPACPRIIPYTPDQQLQAAQELAALAPDAMLRTMISDYGLTRNWIRTCRGEPIPGSRPK
ncbi:hypothetical protein FBZ92_109189 [Nitrospirillum viridazoti]|uniref:Uncharacterized protein n=1 Tax=Nitrospirillum amazonense TaxID=28077 RepID=A0A560II73_9PROT|nr:hypothetical protein FBZ92_109189 [Nitrospirillum amazonense]